MLNQSLSKARILLELQPKVRLFQVPDLLVFTVDQLANFSDSGLAADIAVHFGSTPLIVRSSAGDEDGAFHSKAGAYESVLSVRADDEAALSAAVRVVIESYNSSNINTDCFEVIFQVLVDKPDFNTTRWQTNRVWSATLFFWFKATD